MPAKRQQKKGMKQKLGDSPAKQTPAAEVAKIPVTAPQVTEVRQVGAGNKAEAAKAQEELNALADRAGKLVCIFSVSSLPHG